MIRFAYVISAYRAPAMLGRLVDALDVDAPPFLIHVDAKTPPAVHEELVAAVRRPNVEVLPRHTCHWGGFGHVEATLKGIRRLLDSGRAFDYLFLLSGQDYPIKSDAHVRRELRELGGRSFCLFFPLPAPWRGHGGLDRLRWWHFRRRPLHVRLPRLRRLPVDLRPYGGSAYWCLSHVAVETVHEYVDANPWYVDYFRHVDIPDEIFFQTILGNTRERDRVVDRRLHYTEWSRQPAPAVLTTEDFDALAASRCLFARKFDPAVDARVLDLVDERTRRRTGSATSLERTGGSQALLAFDDVLPLADTLRAGLDR